MDSQTVLITGATSGIGYEFARLFAHRGYNLILISRSVNSPNFAKYTEGLEKTFNIKITTIEQDLSEVNAAQVIFDKIKKKGIKVDILINNAGVGYHSAFIESDWQRQLKLINLNIVALMQMSYLFGGEMKRNCRGKILNIASIAADLPGPYMSTYYASKSFVLSFSYALAEELKASHVKVFTLCPGPIKTSFEKTASMKHTKMFSLLPAKPSSVALLGYIMLKYGGRLRFYGVITKVANVFLRLLPRFVTAKIAKFVDGNPN